MCAINGVGIGSRHQWMPYLGKVQIPSDYVKIVAGTRQPLRPTPPSARPIREAAATKNSADMPVATAAGTQLKALWHTDVTRFGLHNSLPWRRYGAIWTFLGKFAGDMPIICGHLSFELSFELIPTWLVPSPPSKRSILPRPLQDTSIGFRKFSQCSKTESPSRLTQALQEPRAWTLSRAAG